MTLKTIHDQFDKDRMDLVWRVREYKGWSIFDVKVALVVSNYDVKYAVNLLSGNILTTGGIDKEYVYEVLFGDKYEGGWVTMSIHKSLYGSLRYYHKEVKKGIKISSTIWNRRNFKITKKELMP